jgi:anti-sigma factor RsiW
MCEMAQPCTHMRVLTSRYADGSLTGALLAYVKLHLSHCKRCQQAVAAVRAIRGRLNELRSTNVPLGDDRWAAIHAQMDGEPLAGDPSP